MPRARILLADDHTVVLDAFKKLLEPAYDVVGTAADGHALVAAAERLKPDLIILDVAMPNLNGLDACERVRQRLPKAKIIFLTMTHDRDTAAEAIRRGRPAMSSNQRPPRNSSRRSRRCFAARRT
jgi:DNA-binding NarL/FixJ family response regulator